VFIGHCILEGVQCGNQSVWKQSPSEKVGVVALRYILFSTYSILHAVSVSIQHWLLLASVQCKEFLMAMYNVCQCVAVLQYTWCWLH
jgi:hypothetical protein